MRSIVPCHKNRMAFYYIKPTLIALCLYVLSLGSTAKAEIPCFLNPCQFYIGVFGGGGCSNNPHVTQRGTAFFTPPLDVDAHGHANHHSIAMGGAHIGWSNPIFCRNLSLGTELEGFYFKELGNAKTGHLINITDRLPEHDFIDTLPKQCGVFLANALLRLHTAGLNRLEPYLGLGIGATKVWISGADSLQLSPPELDVNHFNSDRSSSDWTFTVQAKAGIGFNICSRWRLFAEYRFLHLSPTRYTFGETVYPNHVPTTRWHVHLGSLHYNIGVVGIEFLL